MIDTEKVKSDELTQAIVGLAQENNGQPVAVIAGPNGSLTIGVLSMVALQPDDWLFNPIVIDAETVKSLLTA